MKIALVTNIPKRMVTETAEAANLVSSPSSVEYTSVNIADGTMLTAKIVSRGRPDMPVTKTNNNAIKNESKNLINIIDKIAFPLSTLGSMNIPRSISIRGTVALEISLRRGSNIV